MTDTSFPIERISEVDMTPSLDAAIRECLRVCFPSDAEAFSGSRAWHGSAPEYSLLLREGGLVVGHVGIVVRDIRAGTRTVRIAGVQNMAIRPQGRKTGLGGALLSGAMDEAARRDIHFGLLFCVPDLERYYARFAWILHTADGRMDFNGERNIPIPGKNLCMVKLLAGRSFPAGLIHLQGADW